MTTLSPFRRHLTAVGPRSLVHSTMNSSHSLSDCSAPWASLLLLAALWITPALGTAATIPFSADADASIMENNKGESNTGGDTQLAAGTLANGERTRLLLHFDLSSVPANAIVHSVTLTTTAVKQNFSAPTTVFAIHRMLVSWKEGSGVGLVGQPASAGDVTWKWRAAPSTDWGSPGGKAGTDFAAAASSLSEISEVGPLNFESSSPLISDVQHWIADPSSNFGWMLKAASEAARTTARRFGSLESDGNGPSLVIDYEVPTPELKVTSPLLSQGKLSFHWTATNPPYQVQTRSTITGDWVNVGAPQSGTEISVPTDGAQAYYRVIEAQPNVQ